MLDINFLHYALLLFLFSAGLLVIISKLGQPESAEKLQGLIYQKSRPSKLKQYPMDTAITLGLIVLVLILWLVFSPWGVGG